MTTRLTVRGAIGIVALLGCGSGSSGGANQPTTPTPPTPPSANVTLTLISQAGDATAEAGQLYAYIGDSPITRASMPQFLNENAPALRITPGSSRNTVTLQVPRGKVVTLFAIEFNTNGATPVVLPQAIATQAPNNFVEFQSWVGDFAATPEPGVAVLTADRDKTVTANFVRQRGVAFRQLGCAHKKIQLNGPGLLTFGRTVADTAPDLTSRNAFTSGTSAGTLQTEHDITFLYAKQGTTITLRSLSDLKEDRSPAVLRSGFMRWDGRAAACGTNVLCQIPIPPPESTAVAPIRMINGFSLTTLPSGNVFGCNCVPGSTNPPCQQLP